MLIPKKIYENMRKNNFLSVLCVMVLMSMVAVHADAQDLKSILTGVAKAVVGDKATTESSIIGTWKYVGPQCQFESENLLAKAGGEVAAKEVEEKMQIVYDKVGMNGCQYTFNEDGTYSYTVKKRTTSGTYTFDNEAKTITMKGKLGVKTVAHVTVTGNDMSLVFNADKLMSVLKLITGATSKVNSTAATINSVAGAYDGLMLGFELKK
jgi:VCBS repeat-containing protein